MTIDRLQQISVRLPRRLIERMRVRQEAIGVAPSEQIRRALNEWLSRGEAEARASRTAQRRRRWKPGAQNLTEQLQYALLRMQDTINNQPDIEKQLHELNAEHVAITATLQALNRAVEEQQIKAEHYARIDDTEGDQR
jgi:Vps23 core domain.